MGACTEQEQLKLLLFDAVYQKPVRLYMTLAETGIIPGQFMIPIALIKGCSAASVLTTAVSFSRFRFRLTAFFRSLLNRLEATILSIVQYLAHQGFHAVIAFVSGGVALHGFIFRKGGSGFLVGHIFAHLKGNARIVDSGFGTIDSV